MKKIILFLFIAICFSATAQVNYGGEPYSFTHSIDNKNITFFHVSAPNVESLLAEDAKKEGKSPVRFAQSISTELNGLNFGEWREVENGNLWLGGIQSKGAKSLGLSFRDFKLKKGSSLFIYSADHKQLLGAFTSENNRENGIFATALISGEKLIIEYFTKERVEKNTPFRITEIVYAYRSSENSKGFGTSGDCEVNINCPEGINFQIQKKGVARIMSKAGSDYFWCTGSLINNTAEDKTPYLLTAYHCGIGASAEDINQWIFSFNYESENCENPVSEPDYNEASGAVKIANSQQVGNNNVGSDFFLVKLNENLPASWNLFLNGWTRAEEISDNGVTIHHPDGDIKKVSTYTTEPTLSYWDESSKLTHWKVEWSETVTNWGVTEGGSSGAPLFTSDGLIAGTLTGGGASCTNQTAPDYYGRMGWQWDNETTVDSLRLSPWLDPLGLNPTTFNGSTFGVKNQENSSIKIFPSPATEYISFNGNNNFFGNTVINIYSITGNLVAQHKVNIPKNGDCTIDISTLRKGVYILSFVNGDKTINTKALIQ